MWSLHSRANRRSLFGAVLAVFGCLAHGAEGATFNVNDPGDEPDVFPGDGVAETSPGSAITTLRSAIEEANAFPGADVINLPNVTIQLETALPPLSDTTGGTTIHGSGHTHPVAGDFPYALEAISGGARLDGTTLDTQDEGYAEVTGLRIHSAHNVVEGITVVNFPQDGIEISGGGATDNVIRASYIGIQAKVLLGNKRHGVYIAGGASNNTLGGVLPNDRNVIADNRTDGIHITGVGTDGNRVLNNFIGCDIQALPECTGPVLTGQIALSGGCLGEVTQLKCNQTSYPNRRNNVGVSGGARNNVIGDVGMGNCISGSIWYILPLCATYAVPLYCTVDPDIRPSTGPGQSGIVIEGAGTEGNQVSANLIGFRHLWKIEPDGDGYRLSDIWERSGAAEHSVILQDGASDNRIGGADDSLQNVINYSLGTALVIRGGGTSGNQVLGNTISGEKVGVEISDGALTNVIGDGGGWGNIIKSREHGIVIKGIGSTQNRIIGNTVSQNGFSGVAIFGGATANEVGGANNGEGNVIAANCSDGVIVFDPGTEENQILGNDISDNGEIGVFMVNGASSNVIGGATAGAGNKIHDNAVTGVEIHDVASTGNQILGNAIHGNGTRGVFMVDGTSGNIVGGVPLAQRNQVYGNALSGIEINGANTFENQIRLNSIYDNGEKGILLSFGANKAIAPPVIQTFIPVAGTAPANSFVDIFSDTAEEGKRYIGSTSTDAEGNFSVALDLQAYKNTNLTTTASDDTGNTSEFSAPIAIIAPAFTEVDSDRVVVEGDDFSLGVAVTGSPVVRFQWQYKTALGEYGDLQESAGITGTTSSELNILNVDPGREGYYRCVADNGLGAVNSREIFIRVVSAGLEELECNTLGDTIDGNTTSFARLLAEPGVDGLVSLREALTAANSMEGANTIRFSVEGTVQPASPLPALSDNTGGLLLDGTGGVVLDGSLLADTGSGLLVTSGDNRIAGLTIQHFPEHGVTISGATATGNQITGCRIGTDGETALGNGINGVMIVGGASGNIIGGSEPGAGNRIAGNQNAGIELSGANTTQNHILGNTIGQDESGLPVGGNRIAGVRIADGAAANHIGGDGEGDGNHIQGNDGIGVWVVGAGTIHNTILGNTITGNGELGIRLFEGGNAGILRPAITRVSPLAGTAPPNSRVDCYADSEDEGQDYLITLQSNQDGAFGAALDLHPQDGRYLTAIATDGSGNTSAFSRPAAIDFTPPILVLNGAQNLTLECGSPFEDPGATALDNIDGNLFNEIVAHIENASGESLESLDGAPAGNYTIEYQVSDSSGLAALPVTRSVTISDSTPPMITLNGPAGITLGCGEEFSDPGATAEDTCDSAPTVVASGTVDTTSPGEYELHYTARDAAGNETPSSVRTVTVEDREPPQLVLNGSASLEVECGGAFSDPGATAEDDCGGALSADVVGSVNIEQAGDYTLTYHAVDGAGNEAPPVTRTVTVADHTAPVLTLVGASVLVLHCGEGYAELGATVDDACDQVAEVVITGEFDSNAIGEYTLHYDVTDVSGNSAETVTRTISVVGEVPPRIMLTGAPELTIECSSTYQDAGASAVDGCQTDISSLIVTDNPVNTAVPGVYIVTYTVSDPSGAAADPVTRSVTVLPCATPCDATCLGEPDDQIDADGDGLSACKEQCAGTSEQNPDSDGDGMPDGFEYRNQLDLDADDSGIDLDRDGLTNLEEYLESGAPRNAATPVRSWYVSPTGVDASTAGTVDEPWQSIGYALERLKTAPSGRKQLLIDSGLYVEDITLLADIAVRALPDADVEIMGSVAAPANSILRDVTITSEETDTSLLTIGGNGVHVSGCTFNGEFGSNLTGVTVDVDATQPSTIESSIFTNLLDGISVGGALPHVRHCQFIGIGGAAILVLPEAELSSDSIPGRGLNGWNDFSQLGEGLAIANRSASAISAQWNEWGTEDSAALESLVEGEVNQANALAEGGADAAAALEMVVFNGKSQARIKNAQVTLTSGGTTLHGATDSAGRAAFPALPAASWQVTVMATGFPDATKTYTLAAGDLEVANIALFAEEVVEPGGCPAPTKSNGAAKRGDLALTGLLVAVLLAGRGRRARK